MNDATTMLNCQLPNCAWWHWQAETCHHCNCINIRKNRSLMYA